MSTYMNDEFTIRTARHLYALVQIVAQGQHIICCSLRLWEMGRKQSYGHTYMVFWGECGQVCVVCVCVPPVDDDAKGVRTRRSKAWDRNGEPARLIDRCGVFYLYVRDEVNDEMA